MRARHIAALLLLLLPARAFAIRPFVTDDGRVVGEGLLQLETWFQLDREGLQHWLMPAFGPHDRMEISIGMVHGATFGDAPPRYSLNGPLVQVKILLEHAQMNSWPGGALAFGSLLPLGFGGFTGTKGGFTYLALTENLGENERLLIHANIGVSLRLRDDGGGYEPAPLLGLGAQLRTIGGLHAVGEIAYGDAFTGEHTGIIQLGGRFIFNDHVQTDFTVGTGVFGTLRSAWGTVGLRLVTGELF